MSGSSGKKRLFWTIRDWFWLSMLTGIVLCWWMDASGEYYKHEFNSVQTQLLLSVGGTTEAQINSSIRARRGKKTSPASVPGHLIAGK